MTRSSSLENLGRNWDIITCKIRKHFWKGLLFNKNQNWNYLYFQVSPSSHSINCVYSCGPFVSLLKSSAGLVGCQNSFCHPAWAVGRWSITYNIKYKRTWSRNNLSTVLAESPDSNSDRARFNAWVFCYSSLALLHSNLVNIVFAHSSLRSYDLRFTSTTCPSLHRICV